DADAAQLGETLLHAAFDDVLQLDHAQDVATPGDDERCAALLGDPVDRRAHRRRETAAPRVNVGIDRVGGALADLGAVEVHPAHARLRGEGDKVRVQLVNLPLADAVFFFGEHDDAAALGGFVGER